MITVTDDFLNFSRQDDKEPVFFIQWAGPIVVSKRTASMDAHSAGGYYDGLLDVSLFSPKSIFFDSSLTAGKYSFTISENVVNGLNNSVSMANQIFTNGLLGTFVNIKFGWKDLSVFDYVTLASGNVEDIQYTDGIWIFTLTDLNKTIGKPLVKLQTSLTVGDGDEVNAIFTDTVGNYITNTAIIAGYNALGIHVCIQVEDELIEYTSFDATFNFFDGYTRGAFGTVAAPNAAGTPIKQVLIFQMRPGQFLLHAFTTTPTGDPENHYDLGLSWFGFGFFDSQIDIDSFERFDHSFSMHEGALSNRPIVINEDIENGREWLEENILQPAGACFVASMVNGTIKIKNLGWGIYNSPLVITPAPIRTNFIVSTGESFGNVIDNREFFANDFSLRYRKSTNGRGEGLLQRYQIDESVDEFEGQSLKELNYGSVFDDGSFNGAIHAINVNRERWGKFHAPPAKITMNTTWEAIILEPGDEILLSDQFLPKLQDGTTGFLNERIILTGTTLNLASGEINLEGLAFEAWRLIPNDVIITSIGALNIPAPTATLSADKSGTFGAADAFSTTITTPWHLAIFEIEINLGGANVFGTHSHILLQASALTPSTTTFLAREDFFRIPFEVEVPINAKRLFLYLFSTSDHIRQNLTPITSAQFKLDWYFSTQAEIDSPTVELIDIHLVEFTDTITTL